MIYLLVVLLSPILIIIFKILYPLVAIIKYKIKYRKQLYAFYRPLAGIILAMRKYKISHNDSGAFFTDIAKENP